MVVDARTRHNHINYTSKFIFVCDIRSTNGDSNVIPQVVCETFTLNKI